MHKRLEVKHDLVKAKTHERVPWHHRPAPLDVVDSGEEEVSLPVGDGLLQRDQAAHLGHRLDLRREVGQYLERAIYIYIYIYIYIHIYIHICVHV